MLTRNNMKCKKCSQLEQHTVPRICINSLRREYVPGKPLSNQLRHLIIELYPDIETFPESWNRRGQGGSKSNKLNDDVLQSVEVFKLTRPSVSGKEIKHRL